MRCFSDIVLPYKFAGLLYGYFTLNVSKGGLLKILRGLEPIYRLQTDGRPPRLGTIFLSGFSLTDVLVEIQI